MPGSSYADWLLEQGIDNNVDVQNRSNADNTEITQIPKQKKDIATKGNVEQAGSVVPIPDSTDDKGLFDSNTMVQEYMAKFHADLNTYIISSRNEEDTMDRINRVSNTLHNMGADPSVLALSLKKNTEETQDIHKKNADEPDLQDNKDGNNSNKPLQSEIDNASVEPNKENTEDKMKEEEQKLNENNSDDQKPPTTCKTTEDNTNQIWMDNRIRKKRRLNSK